MPRVVVLFAIACACGDNRPPRVIDAAVPAIDAPPPDAYIDRCKVQDETGEPPICDRTPAPGPLEVELQWSWMGPTGFTRSIITPLVANLTDDNGDGTIDLCDTPDVVVVASPMSGQPGTEGRIFVLDGKTGGLRLEIPMAVDATVTPALGDLDHDRVPEIVTVDRLGRILIFDHTGALVHGPAGRWAGTHHTHALALADLDGDGEVEILGGTTVFDHEGTVRWSAGSASPLGGATTAADLDGDGLLEVVLGHAAYRHDGTPLWTTDLAPGFPQVANLDADPQPEVLLTNANGVSLIEHDGSVRYEDLRPAPGIHGVNAWIRPATIADYDGDGRSDFALCSQTYFGVYTAAAVATWHVPVTDQSGIAGSTAFDLRGSGRLEPVFADEQTLYVFDASGASLFSVPRTSGTLTEYPIVADIDNDGAAEIVVTSNTYPGVPQTPTVRAFRDKHDRWMPARRIWNQHTYHVTNVAEDGTIPAHEVPASTRTNTFRTNAQIKEGRVCRPPPLE